MISQSLKLKFTLLVLLSFGLFIALNDFQKNLSSQFEVWKIKYNIKYESTFENAYREKIFTEKKASIDLHNSAPTRKYNKGLNQFSAMTKQQFRANYLTLQTEAQLLPSSDTRQEEIILRAGDIDWRKLGAITPIKDQGHCGSCWAFSSTGGLEGISKITTGNLLNFSEQQLVDCVTLNSGCHGGQMRRALLYVRDNGITLASDYPYTATQGICQKPKGDFKISGYTNITNCNGLANALINQPIMVGVDADNWSDYESGIFDGCAKQKGVFNHGVLVVGMTQNYWIIKNQWTTQWGQNGYMRLAKGDTCNVCDDGMLLYK